MMNKKGKYILLITSFIVVIIGFIKIQSKDQLEKVKIALDWTPNTNHSGIYVAKDQEYYQNVGLDVEIIQPAQMATESLVNTNKVQFGVSFMPNLILSNEKNGTDLESIMALVGTDRSGFASRSNKKIKTPKDFENKTYCGSGSDVEVAMINSMMKEVGANPQLVNFQTTNINFLNAPNECDFMWIYDGWEAIIADEAGIDYKMIYFNDYLPEQYAPILITNQEYIKKNPEIVQKFVFATQKGYQKAIEDPELAANTLMTYSPELADNKKIVKKSQQKVSKYYQNENQSVYGYQSPIVWEKYQQFMIENKIISNIKSEYFTNKFLNK